MRPVKHYFMILCYNSAMTLIGMSEAAQRAQMSRVGIRRGLQNAGVPLVKIAGNALAVDDADLENYLQLRPTYAGRGRPPGAKNKPKGD